MISGSNNTPNIRNTSYSEPIAPLRATPPAAQPETDSPVAPAPSSQPAAPPPEAAPATDEVRKLGVSDASPVQVSFQAPAAPAAPESIQGVRRLNATEDIMAMPDLPSSEDLQEAVGYYQSALSAVQEGALDIAQDFLAWARELDPGAPDLPFQ